MSKQIQFLRTSFTRFQENQINTKVCALNKPVRSCFCTRICLAFQLIIWVGLGGKNPSWAPSQLPQLNKSTYSGILASKMPRMTSFKMLVQKSLFHSPEKIRMPVDFQLRSQTSPTICFRTWSQTLEVH